MIYKDRFYKLEMLILIALEKHDCTINNLVHIIQKESHGVMNIRAGVILSSLFYFEEAMLISSYERDDIYYHLEGSGIVRLETLKRRYYQMQNAIDNVLHYQGDLYE